LAKKRLVKDYDALPEEITRLIKMKYPSGYAESLITYNDAQGKKVSALPFETDDIYYLIRMTILEAKKLVKDDEDFDEDGQLIKENFAEIEVDDEFDGQGEEDEDDNSMSEEDDHIIVTRRRGGDDEEGEDVADDSEY
jgi:DNA-directed RNA polymerase subunit delta